MTSTAIIYTGQLMTRMISNEMISAAIIDVASSIYNILYGIDTISDPYLENNLFKIDIKAQLKTIECLIKNIDPRLKSDSLEISLFQLHEIIIKIREDLKQLNQKYLDHKEKWFKHFRTFDTYKEVEILKDHSNILNKRLDLFMKVFQVESIKLSIPNDKKKNE